MCVCVCARARKVEENKRTETKEGTLAVVGRRRPPPQKKLHSFPLRPSALLRVGRGLAASPARQEQPREQQDVSRDERREREAQAAPREVERLAHVFF